MINYNLNTDTWGEEELQAIDRVIDSNYYTLGKETKAFEQEFARYVGAKYAVMVNSGSSANLLMVAGAVYGDYDLSMGDQVIVPAVSWSTTYFPLTQHGLILNFVDIDAQTLNIDPTKIEAAITPETKAIMAVNLLGNPCDFDALNAICEKHNLILLEDNCESLGATYKGKHTGTYGLMGTYSTFYSHHMCTMEGGLVVTDDEDLYHILLCMRSHGWLREQPEHSKLNYDEDDFKKLFKFVLPAYNIRPIEFEGAIGREQLKKLPAMIDGRRKNNAFFVDHMQGVKNIRLQQETGQSSWFGFAMILQNELAHKRPELVKLFKENGIASRPIVAGNFTKNKVMNHLPHVISGSLKGADELDESGIFIGSHHTDVTEQLGQVINLIKGFSERYSKD